VPEKEYGRSVRLYMAQLGAAICQLMDKRFIRTRTGVLLLALTVARDGVRLKLVPTNGAVDNLRLLQDPRSGVGARISRYRSAVSAYTLPGGSDA